MLLEGRPDSSISVLVREAGKSVTDGPCDLFRRIQKRDGRIVDFDPPRITEAIFKAAQSVGGKDRRRSETLTEYVILDLANRYQDNTNLLNIELVQDSIERTLVEKGHYRTARAFITYRNERSRRRALRGEIHLDSELNDGVATLESACVSTSHGENLRWDRERIVKALVKETNLPYDSARKVSHAVELEIIHSKISHLTAPLIRELTNAKLLQMGFENERRLHARLGLPVYDVERRLLDSNSSSTGLSIEGEILRQFALEKVFPLAVAEAHAAQDLHVHNLSTIHLPAEVVRDLDFPDQRPWFQPQQAASESTDSWEAFLSSWETAETRILRGVGRRLIWENVDAAIAYHSRGLSGEIRSTVRSAMRKLWRNAGDERNRPTIVWRLAEKPAPHWRGKFIGARQLSLLPEDEIDTLHRAALMEMLRQVEEGGPYWAACGVEFEVIVDVESGESIEPALASAIAGCLAVHAPLKVLFRRDSAVSRTTQGPIHPVVQTITLNFPRAAALAEGDDDRLCEWIEDRLQLIAQAHLAKRSLVADRIKCGALESLDEPETSPRTRQPRLLEDGVYGIGVWGLAAMTEIHRGEHPTDSVAALRWLLQITARLDLRLREIGERYGIHLRFVSIADDGMVSRMTRSILSAGLGCEPPDPESVLGIDWNDPESIVREGKLHPFLAFGQVSMGSRESSMRTIPDLVERLQYLASTTHVGGTTWAGEWTHCGNCGSVFGEIPAVCEACGGDSLAEIHRHGQGMYNRIARL